MAKIIDFVEYKKKKEQEQAINVDLWNNILDYEQMAENMQMLIDQILEQSPLVDSDGNFHYTIYLDDK